VLYRHQRQYAKAKPLFERALFKRALRILKKKRRPEDYQMARVLHNVAVLYRDQIQYKKAEPLFKRALSLLKKHGPANSHVGRIRRDLAELYRQKRLYGKAKSLFRLALFILERALDPEHPEVAECLEKYALLLRDMHRPDQAAALKSRARAIRAKHALLEIPVANLGDNWSHLLCAGAPERQGFVQWDQQMRKFPVLCVFTKIRAHCRRGV
jgi:tetratricopeptide (TPR) repeat protein